MRLLSNWRKVLTKSWSIRLMGIAAVLSGAEAALPFVERFVDWPDGVLAGLSFGVVCAAFMARLAAQKTLEDDDGKPQ